MNADSHHSAGGHLFLLQCISCFFMCGVIWFVQVVHYPLFDQVGLGYFAKYEEQHTLLTTFVVLPPMFVELLTSGLLVHMRPHFVSRSFAMAILTLTVVVWLLTFAVHVPQHDVLGRGYDGDVHEALVSTNWLRTVLWTIKAAIVLRLLRRGVLASDASPQMGFPGGVTEIR